jgi:hypothetical protein
MCGVCVQEVSVKNDGLSVMSEMQIFPARWLTRWFFTLLTTSSADGHFLSQTVSLWVPQVKGVSTFAVPAEQSWARTGTFPQSSR